MKTLSYLLVIGFFFVACNNDQPEIPEETCPYLERIQPLLDCMNMPRPDDSYCYPCYPNVGLNDCSQGLDNALIIPVTILEKMSTQAVIQAIWEYPYTHSSIIVDSWSHQHAFETVFFNNNAYIESLKRPDTGDVLLERLLLLNFIVPQPFVYMPMILEMLISQPVFLNQFDNNAKKKIVEVTLKNIILREDAWGGPCFCWFPSWILIGRTMLSAGYAPFVEAVNSDEELKNFLDGSFWNSDYNHCFYYDYLSTPLNIPPKIIDFSNNFLNN